jgi:hypothetical protein
MSNVCWLLSATVLFFCTIATELGPEKGWPEAVLPVSNIPPKRRYSANQSNSARAKMQLAPPNLPVD